MTTVQEILNINVACLSSDIVKILVGQDNIKEDTARKRVSRAVQSESSGVNQLSYINFPKNEKFIYSIEHFGSPEYWKALELALEKSRSCYLMAYNAVKYRGGVIPASSFNSLCGSPIKQKKHIPARSVRENLIKANILVEKSVDVVGECLLTGEINRENSSVDLMEASRKSSARVIIETNIVIPLIKKWLINIGFTSKNAVRVRSRGEFPKILNYEWDITAPSYLNLLSNFSSGKPKPGFIGCDIYLADDVHEKVIETFIKKCQNCSGSSSSTNVLYIFIAKSFHYDALMMARDNPS